MRKPAILLWLLDYRVALELQFAAVCLLYWEYIIDE